MKKSQLQISTPVGTNMSCPQLKNLSREKHIKKPFNSRGRATKHIACKCSSPYYGSSVFGPCTHLARAVCGYKTQVVVVLLLARSSSTRGTLTQTSKPQRMKSDLAAVLRLQTNRTLELYPTILLGFKTYLAQYFNENSSNLNFLLKYLEISLNT